MAELLERLQTRYDASWLQGRLTLAEFRYVERKSCVVCGEPFTQERPFLSYEGGWSYWIFDRGPFFPVNPTHSGCWIR